MATASANREAFLQAIREDPTGLTQRLAFANWLDDHGDAELAEFIRGSTQILSLVRRLAELHPKVAYNIRGFEPYTAHIELVTIRKLPERRGRRARINLEVDDFAQEGQVISEIGLFALYDMGFKGGEGFGYEYEGWLLLRRLVCHRQVVWVGHPVALVIRLCDER